MEARIGRKRSGSGREGKTLSLRAKLLLLIFGATTTLVISLVALGFHALRQASDTAQEVSRAAFESQAQAHISRITEKNAKRNSAILNQTLAEATFLAAAAGQFYSAPEAYAALGASYGPLDLRRKQEGQHLNGPEEQASIYLPNFASMDASLHQSIQVGRMLDSLAFNVLETDPNAAAVYLSLADEMTRYYPKVDLSVLPPDFQITEHFLFTGVAPAANPDRETRWSRVYEDPAGQGILVSAMAPVYADASEFVGVVGVDFRLSDLVSIIENENLTNDSYSFMIDGEGKAIALPERAYTELLGRAYAEDELGIDLATQDGDLAEAIAKMRSGKIGIVRVRDRGSEKFLAFAPVGSSGWSMATVVETEIILSDIGALETMMTEDARKLAVKRLIPMGIGILFVVTSLALFFAYQFTAPLRELTAAAAAIGRREWDTPMPPAGDDEVGLLSRTLGSVAKQLRELINELETRVTARTEELSAALVRIEESNQQLSNEVDERKRVDLVRRDMELRFKQAFQSAPIGMALMNTHGYVINPNPHMRALFWPDLDSDVTELLDRVIVESEMERFEAFVTALDEANETTVTAEFECRAFDGSERLITFYFSRIEQTETQESYYVLLAQDVTATREMTEKLQQQANYDELTGLQNRRAFAKALQHYSERSQKLGEVSHLLFMDLDQFKIVNDTCGHAEGDRLLVEVSALISSCVRASDVVARLGGDEFAVLLIDCDTEIAIRKAEQIRTAVQDFEFFSGDDLFRVGVSIGLVKLAGEDIDLSELQQLADAACYAAKEAGRNRVHVVEAGGDDKADEHRGDMRWVQRLHDAMDNNRFVLHGQRIRPLNNDSDELDHIEVLLRLRDPKTRRLIPPGAFLPAAERYGLLVDLDKWVVTNLLRSIHVFNTMYPDGQRYWINLSGASLGDESFSELLLKLLKESGLAPGTVNFEITETVVIRSMKDANALIAELHDLGCEIALDDFGGSLSSLVYLKKLNVDYLKIDGAFVREIATDDVDRIFVKSIVEIANQLGIKTIAEFVESEETLQIVEAMGVDYAQGFGIHRPASLIPKNGIGTSKAS